MSQNYFRHFDCKPRLSSNYVKEVSPSYSQYLQIPTLLSLQSSEIKKELHHHDEHLFIVVHQTFELWFKQILHDLQSIQKMMDSRRTSPEKEAVIIERLRRMDKIIRFTIPTFDVLETMVPLNFLEFRDYITPASGFQSAQFKELEVSLGLRNFTSGKYLDILKGCDPNGYERLKKCIESKSFKNTLYDWMISLYDDLKPLMEEFVSLYLDLRRKSLKYIADVKLDDEVKKKEMIEDEIKSTERFFSGDYLSMEERGERKDRSPEKCKSCSKRRIAILFVSSYMYEPVFHRMAQILDGAISFEEGLLEWKTHHARMVERMIGHKTGTGSSSGVTYLDRTTKPRIFHDLWHVRSHLIAPTRLPKITSYENYPCIQKLQQENV